MSFEYVSVSLPGLLIDKIDEVIESAGVGYQSRPEFVKDAVRRLLKAHDISFSISKGKDGK